jgi:hypothetical protein
MASTSYIDDRLTATGSINTEFLVGTGSLALNVSVFCLADQTPEKSVALIPLGPFFAAVRLD